MKKTWLISGIMMLTVISQLNAAKIVTVDTAVDVRLNSAFVWRGELISDEPVFQPSITVGMNQFSANIWGTWDITHVDDSSKHTRMDAAIDYTFTDGKHMLRPGLVGYIYYDDADGEETRDTFEIFAEYAMDTLFLPRISVYYDFAEIEGLYASFSVAHGFHIIKNRMDLELKLLLGLATENYVDEIFGLEADEEAGIEEFHPKGTSLVDLTLSASFPIVVSKSSMLIPHVRYNSIPDSDIADAQDARDIDANSIVYGVTYNMLF